MADRKITDLTALAAGSQATGDLVTIVDVSESAAADKNKKMTMENLFKGIPGDVGIGTSSPSRALHVNSGATNEVARFESSDTEVTLELKDSTGTAFLKCRNDYRFGNNSGELVRINSSGNVGIGTASPTARLDVRRGDTDGLIAEFHQSTGFGINIKSSQSVATVQTESNQALTFETGSTATERLRIDSSGNVGIGTTSPDFKLDVNGEVAITEGQALTWHDGSGGRSAQIFGGSGDVLVFRNTSSLSERMRIDSSGNVGIGTASPATALHVSGSGTQRIRITGTGTANAILTLDAPSSFTNYIEYGASASTPLAFYDVANTSERLRIDSSGRLLVGSSSSRANGYGDNAYLQLEGTSYPKAAISTILNSGNANGPSLNFAKTRGTSNGSSTVVQSGDNLGVINFAGGDGTDIKSTGARIRSQVDGTPGSDDMPGRIVFETTSDGSVSPTERMRITSGGNVLFNCINLPSASVQGFLITGTTSGNTSSSGSSTSAYNHFLFYNGNGIVGSISTSGSTTTYSTSSDYRLKENVVDIADGIDRVKQLQPKRFNFIADADATVDGFLAHEAQTVVPEAVTGTHNEVDDDNNPVYQGIDQSKLVPLLTAALQEAIAKIETLETKVAALEAQ